MTMEAVSETAMMPTHRRKLGWISMAALALGGSNLSLFMMSGLINGQGSAGILLLITGVIVSWFAIPCWIELILLYPNRIGGISVNTAAALKSYNPILSSLVGVSYWLCTVPGVSFAAVFIAMGLQQWFFPKLPASVIGMCLVILFTFINFLNVKWIARLAVITAIIAFISTLLSALIPLFFGKLNWVQVMTYHLEVPFSGFFGQFTAVMAGLYLIAFSAPAFEQGLCYVGESKEPIKNTKRMIRVILVITTLYYIVLPLTWYAMLGTVPLTGDYLETITPTFAPMFHQSAKLMSAVFMISNSLICLLSAFSASARSLSQLAQDKLVPIELGKLNKYDAPWAAAVFTAMAAIILVYYGSPNWLMAATNFGYIICVTMATAAVLIMRRLAPNIERPYRASNFSLGLGIVSIVVWFLTIVFGFQQFGLLAMIAGIAFPFSGLILYGWRKISDRRKLNLPIIDIYSLQFKLTGSMVAVLLLDCIGYLIAVHSLPQGQSALITGLEDIFVTVAFLTIAIGLVIPAMVAHTAIEISNATKHLVQGTLTDFAKAMEALGKGELDQARVNINITPVQIISKDEIGQMGKNFNELLNMVATAALGLNSAREGLKLARDSLAEVNINLEKRVAKRTAALQLALDDLNMTQKQLIETAKMAALGGMVAAISHEVNTPLGIGITATSYLNDKLGELNELFMQGGMNKADFQQFMTSAHESLTIILANLNRAANLVKSFKQTAADNSNESRYIIDLNNYLNEIAHSISPVLKSHQATFNISCPENIKLDTYPGIFFQVISILVMNSLIHGHQPNEAAKLTLQVTEQIDSVKLTYTDQGKGIPPEIQQKIFEPFFTTARNKGNVGLGLNIAFNKITHTLKGSITCDSELGKGVTFTIVIPKLVSETV